MSEPTIKEFRAWLETQKEWYGFSPTEPALHTIIDSLDAFERSKRASSNLHVEDDEK